MIDFKGFDSENWNNSGLIYKAQLETFRDLYQRDQELACDVLYYYLEIAFTGKVSIDDNDFRMAFLRSFIPVAKKTLDKYNNKVAVSNENNIKKYKLKEIAEMLNKDMSKTEIAKAIGVSRPTLDNRINMIYEKYHYLIDNVDLDSEVENEMKNEDVGATLKNEMKMPGGDAADLDSELKNETKKNLDSEMKTEMKNETKKVRTVSSAEFMTLTDKGLIKGRNGSNKSEYITVAGERIKVAW